MPRKLKFEELEPRIAPSMGLLSFLNELADLDPDLGGQIRDHVDLETGEVADPQGAADAFNQGDTGVQVRPIVTQFQVSDDLRIPESTAEAIRNLLLQR
ncbi:MAG: hypothetical protein JSV80_06480 [Acidobacteriota bacterium]|nr:MAG: hypothetical protein JSV80_06480 [Acidobacteriota bacterium]